MNEFYEILERICGTDTNRYDERSIDEMVNSGDIDYLACAHELPRQYHQNYADTTAPYQSNPFRA